MIASSVVGLFLSDLYGGFARTASITLKPLRSRLPTKKRWEKSGQVPLRIGCKKCSYTGYLGRIGIYEDLMMSNTMKIMIHHQATSDEMRNQALKEGMVTMLNDGCRR